MPLGISEEAEIVIDTVDQSFARRVGLKFCAQHGSVVRDVEIQFGYRSTHRHTTLSYAHSLTSVEQLRETLFGSESCTPSVSLILSSPRMPRDQQVASDVRPPNYHSAALPAPTSVVEPAAPDRPSD